MDSRAGTAKRSAARTSSGAPVAGGVTAGEPDVQVTSTAADEPAAVPVLPVVPPTVPAPGPPPAPVAPAVPAPVAVIVPGPVLTPEQAACRHTVTRTRMRGGKLQRYCEECDYAVPVAQAPREVLRPLTEIAGTVGRLGRG